MQGFEKQHIHAVLQGVVSLDAESALWTSLVELLNCVTQVIPLIILLGRILIMSKTRAILVFIFGVSDNLNP